MKKIFFFFLTITSITFSQETETSTFSEETETSTEDQAIHGPGYNILNSIFIGNHTITNDIYRLELAGVINTKAQRIQTNGSEFDNYYNESKYDYISEILSLDQLSFAKQNKSNVPLNLEWETYKDRYGNQYDSISNKRNIYNKCSWNWTGENTNLNMLKVDKYSTHAEPQLFPTFEFLRGKLLTIKHNDSSVGKDYLFSVSKSDDYNDYGHQSLSFNLSDDDEKGYTINTIMIYNQVYLIFSKSEMSALGFKTEFTSNSNFKIICDESNYTSTFKSPDRNSYDYQFKNRKCHCECDKDYLTLFRKQTKYRENSINLGSDDLLYLFKLVAPRSMQNKTFEHKWD